MQTASICAGLPSAMMVILMAISIWRALNEEPVAQLQPQ
ncbi:hypothetical protein [Marinobacterium jannaschii]